jgi:hypothetical protein
MIPCAFYFVSIQMLSAMFKKTAPWIFFLVFLISGFFSGRFVGNRFLSNLIFSNGAFPLLISRPVVQFYEMTVLLNSGNPYSRLSGYYALLDNRMINTRFLMERFNKEQDYTIKRTILWILSFSDDTGDVLKFYASVFHNNDPFMKDILALMKRVDGAYYRKFIERNTIDKTLKPSKTP